MRGRHGTCTPTRVDSDEAPRERCLVSTWSERLLTPAAVTAPLGTISLALPGQSTTRRVRKGADANGSDSVGAGEASRVFRVRVVQYVDEASVPRSRHTTMPKVASIIPRSGDRRSTRVASSAE